MVGCTQDESALFLIFTALPTQKDQHDEIIRREFGPLAERILANYPVVNEARVIREQLGHIMTDLVFGAQTRLIARAASSAGPKAYRYLFSRGTRLALMARGAHHGSEVPFVFGTDHPLWNWAAWDRELSEIIQRYWVNFAAMGDPNGAGLPTWPAYDRETEQTLELGDEIKVLRQYRHGPHDAIDEHLRSRR